jgi:replicative DNA helicase
MLSIGTELLLKILQNKLEIEFSKLTQDMFEQHEVKMYKYILEHIETFGVLPDLKTFSNEFTIDINDISVNEPFEYYVIKLKDRFVGNLISQELPKINSNFTKNNLEVLESFKKIITKGEFDLLNINNNIVRMEEVGENVYEDILSKRVKGGITGIPTAWETLDNATGGFQNGDIILVLARPKKGKTITLLCLADAAYNAGYNPMIISMEMTKLQIGARVFAKRASLNMTDVYRGQISDWGLERLQDNIFEMKENISKSYYYVEGQLNKDISEIAAIIRRYKPSIVYIDGGYLIKVKMNYNAQRWERMTEVIERLKSIASKENIPIVVSFQFTRQVSRRAKSVEDDAFERIQLSDAISQIATTGIAILDDEFEQNNIKVIEIIGGRNAEHGRFRIMWDWERMNFSEIKDNKVIYEDVDAEEGLIQWE